MDLAAWLWKHARHVTIPSPDLTGQDVTASQQPASKATDSNRPKSSRPQAAADPIGQDVTPHQHPAIKATDPAQEQTAGASDRDAAGAKRLRKRQRTAGTSGPSSTEPTMVSQQASGPEHDLLGRQDLGGI